MNLRRRFSRSHSFLWLALAGLGLVGAALICWAATGPYGIGVSPDSVEYIGTARNLVQGRGLRGYRGGPLEHHAPLYPAALALLSLATGQDALVAARALNALLYGLFVVAAGWLAWRALGFSPLLTLGAAVGALAAWPVYAIAIMAWSEPLFTAFGLAALALAYRYRDKGDLATSIALAGATLLACLTRYAGLVLLGFGVLVTARYTPGGWRAKLTRCVLYGLIAGAPVALWLLRGLARTGVLWESSGIGKAWTAAHTLILLSRPLEAIGSWYGLPALSRPLLLLATLALVAAGLFLTLRWRGAGWGRAGLLALFVAVYVGGLLVMQFMVNIIGSGGRFYAPIYIPILLLTLQGGRWLYAWDGWGRLRQVARAILIIAGLAWLGFMGWTLAGKIGSTLAEGMPGYMNKRWRESPTLQYIQAAGLEKRCEVYTNHVAGLYILTPDLNAGPARAVLKRLNQMQRAACRNRPVGIGAVCLVSFRAGSNDADTQRLLTDAQTLATMSSTVFADGAVYVFTPRRDGCQ